MVSPKPGIVVGASMQPVTPWGGGRMSALALCVHSSYALMLSTTE